MDPEFGLEPWQKEFVRQWERAQDRRNAFVPDPEDYELYADPNPYNGTYSEE